MKALAGPAWMLAASLCFTLAVAGVKVARVDLSAAEIVFWRAAIAVPVLFAWGARSGLRIVNLPLFGVRLGLGFLTMIGWFTAAKGLALANMSIIAKLEPALMALLAPMLLGRREDGGGRILAANALGLLGSVLVLQPDIRVGASWALVAFCAALTSTAAHLCLRVLGPQNRPVALVAWFQLGVTLLAACWLVASDGLRLPPADDIWTLSGIAASSGIGQYCLTRAYAVDSAPRVAAAAYSSVLFSFVVDLVVFSIRPPIVVLLGGICIVVSGAVLLRAPPTTALPPTERVTPP